MKKIISVLFVLILVSVLYKSNFKSNFKSKPQHIPPAPQENFTFDDALDLVNKSECFENLSYLASDQLEGRMSGKKGNTQAAQFIKNKLEKYGLKTYTHRFKISKINPGPNNEIGDDFTENVYALLKGVEHPDEIVVIGAHFDHIGYGPRYSRSGRLDVHNGADDNASGTVAVLEVAKAISKLKPKRTILIQFYSAEEMGLLGSRYYCENPIFPEGNPSISKHVAMVNLDMVGHLDLKEYKAFVPDSIPDMQKIVNNLSEKYGFAKNITGRGTGGSDHASFYNKKVPVAFLHTGTHKHYHTPSDDVDTLNIDGIVEISKYALELIWQLANENTKPDFNLSKFEEMPYTHDHGQEKF